MTHGAAPHHGDPGAVAERSAHRFGHRPRPSPHRRPAAQPGSRSGPAAEDVDHSPRHSTEVEATKWACSARSSAPRSSAPGLVPGLGRRPFLDDHVGGCLPRPAASRTGSPAGWPGTAGRRRAARPGNPRSCPALSASRSTVTRAGTYPGAGAAGRLDTSVGPIAQSSVATSENTTCTLSLGGPAISDTASTMARPRNSFITVVRPRNISTRTIGNWASPSVIRLCRQAARGPRHRGPLPSGRTLFT